ncbi:MAG: hypothetical protein ABI758_02850 [Candidatus Woesebacteria bacterium]
MKKLFLFCLIAGLCVGCSKQPVAPTPTSQAAVTTTVSGTIAKTAGKFYIASPGSVTRDLDSYTVKLDDYVGKNVTVTGQFSGTTLFVDTVKLP